MDFVHGETQGKKMILIGYKEREIHSPPVRGQRRTTQQERQMERTCLLRLPRQEDLATNADWSVNRSKPYQGRATAYSSGIICMAPTSEL